MIGMKRLLPATLIALAFTALAAEAQFTPGHKPLAPRFGGSKTEPPLPPLYFPTLTGKNLAGETVSFPEELADEVSIVFLMWSPEQEIFLESWMPAIRDFLKKYERLHFYVIVLLPKSAESSVVQNGWPWARSSRPALTAEEHQKLLIPVYADHNAVLKSLKIQPDEFLHLVLVNPAKQVEAHQRGARDSGKNDSLDMQVARVVSGNKQE